jgi:hypothetical protein
MILLKEEIQDTKILVEETKTGKNYFIEGIYIQSGIVNHNKRLYPEKVVDAQVKYFTENFINKNRAVGELNHSNEISINPERIAVKILELRKEGLNYTGKSKITNTPCGNIVKGLIDEGIQFGVSTKALGSVVVNEGVSVVQDDFDLRAIDVVYDPSAPGAFVNAIMENREWIYINGILTERKIEEIQKEVNKNVKIKKLNEKSLERIFNKVINNASKY